MSNQYSWSIVAYLLTVSKAVSSHKTDFSFFATTPRFFILPPHPCKTERRLLGLLASKALIQMCRNRVDNSVRN